MAFTKITDTDLVNKGVTGLADTPGLSTTEMQKKFDEIAKDVIIPAFNDVIDELNDTGVAENSQATDPTDDEEKSIQDILDNLKDYTDTEITSTQTQITTKVGELKTYTDELVEGHTDDTDNPHSTTAAQVGAYTKDETDTLITGAKGYSDTNLATHTNNTSNPHSVTASQVGAYTKGEVDSALSDKVDKVSGKCLSANDYTDEEKSNVASNTTARHSHDNKSVLDSITNSILATIQTVATMFASITGVTTTVVDSDEKIPTSGAIVDYVSALGGGDMLKSTYDTNDDGKVDSADNADNAANASKLNNHADTYFATASALDTVSGVANGAKTTADSADGKADTLSTNVGDVQNLETTSRTVVGAINEVKNSIPDSADDISYDDSTTQLGASNVQDAIESVSTSLNALGIKRAVYDATTKVLNFYTTAE